MQSLWFQHLRAVFFKAF